MYETLSVVDVMLDENNPRFAEPAHSQPAAINALIRLAETKLLNLAEDIAVSGELDPTNPPIVWRQKNGELVVIEGNRRFASLKLLRNADLAAGESTQRAIRRIRGKAEEASKDADGPSEVTCWIVGSREEARRWIELRHTGQNEGVGTDPWNSYQSITFRRRPGTAEDKAWLLVRAVIKTYDADESLLSDVRTVREDKFTNLARLIGRPQVRQKMMIEIEDENVEIKSDSDFATDILRTVFRDLSTMTVDEIKTPALQDAYIDEVVTAVRDRYPDQPTDEGEDEDEDTSGATSGGGTGGGGTPGGSAGTSGTSPIRRRTPPKGELKIFHGLTLRNIELRTSNVLKDAQKINIETAPSVCAVMVRVVLELTVTDIGVKRKWFKEGETFRKKMRAALLHLDPNCERSDKRDKELEMAWLKTQSGSGDGMAIDEMNAYVHNFMADPTPASVRGLTSWFRTFLQRLDDYAGENPAQ